MKQLEVLELNGEYISEPLLLPPGDYTLTEFLVADADGQTVYATPKEGSPLAPFVGDPLPAAFTVSDNAVTGLDVQVLIIGDHSAEEFGYVAFRVDIAPFPYFKLAVMVHDSSNVLVFSPVRAFILEEADTVAKLSLAAGIQDVRFHGELSHTYTLALTQPGYRKYTQTFVLGELVSTLDGTPLSVTLAPAFTFIAAFTGDEITPFDFRLNEDVKDLMVDWGDGVVEPVMQVYGTSVQHVFADGKPLHFVSVYGDLSSITTVEYFYGNGSTTEISLIHLPALRTFTTALAGAPIHMDFTHNPLIESLDFESSKVRSFDLPEGVRMRHLNVIFNDSFSASSIEAAIRSAWYANYFHDYRGSFYLSYYPHGETGFVVPLSEEAISQLRDLRSYGWDIWPLEF